MIFNIIKQFKSKVVKNPDCSVLTLRATSRNVSYRTTKRQNENKHTTSFLSTNNPNWELGLPSDCSGTTPRDAAEKPLSHS